MVMTDTSSKNELFEERALRDLVKTWKEYTEEPDVYSDIMLGDPDFGIHILIELLRDIAKSING